MHFFVEFARSSVSHCRNLFLSREIFKSTSCQGLTWVVALRTGLSASETLLLSCLESGKRVEPHQKSSHDQNSAALTAAGSPCVSEWRNSAAVNVLMRFR